MESSITLDRAVLLKLCSKKPDKKSTFWESETPVYWLAANGLITQPKQYYRNVAKLCNIPFVSDVPVKIDSTGTLADIIGSTNLSTLNFYPYEEHGKIFAACADPFQAARIMSVCKEFLADGDILNIVVAPLAVIRTAVAQSLYQGLAAKAETTLNYAMPEYSSRGIITRTFRTMLLVSLLAFGGLLAWNPPAGLLIFFALINIGYLVLNPFKLLICLRGIRYNPSATTQKQLHTIKDSSLPPYTILVPTKEEATMVPKLVASLKRIDYPPEQLDIKIVVEVTDKTTLEAFARAGIDEQDIADMTHTAFHLIKVPTGELSTKPRSCNYALQFARGQLSVIYDAEDRPDPLQLKKAYAALLNERLNTLCVQAKLNFYNVKQNLLTRLFSLEYGFWYDFFLPGLEAWHVPLPLGGTSNHFLTGTLRKIGTWDPYNVTEDADMGWRLSQLGYRTTMLDSYTLEEANSQVWNWITQRTRWQKGFLMTTIVHLRHPVRMRKQLGFYGLISSATIFTTSFLLPLMNPVLWIFFILWYVPPLFGAHHIGLTLSPKMHTIGTINLIFGNGIFILTLVIAAASKKQWMQILFVPLMPFYWLLISVASYRSVYQLLTKPYSWEKTRHGL